MITIYTFSFNESKIIEFRTKFMRDRFPNAKFILYDNQSTDWTVKIAKILGYEVREWNTNSTVRDSDLRFLKNNCWKDADTNWVMVSDMDEIVDINEEDLKLEEKRKTTVIKLYHHEIINKEKVSDFEDLKYAKLYPEEGKRLIFDKRYINEINFEIGAHRACPEGSITFSKVYYPLLHYKWISLEDIVEKYKELAKRLSLENLIYNWSNHYRFSRRKLTKHWNTLIKESIKFK